MSELKSTGIINTSNFNEKFSSEDYVELDYLEATGSQYIITDITSIPAPFSITCKYRKTSTSTSDQCLMGERSLGKFVNIYSNYYETIFGNTSSGIDIVNEDVYVRIDSNSGIWQNETRLISSSTSSGRTAVNNALMFAFVENTSGATAKWFFNGRIYFYTIWSNGNIIFNFIPAKRVSDSVLGMYETVNKKFFTNSGSGTFTSGTVTKFNEVGISPNYVSSKYIIEY